MSGKKDLFKAKSLLAVKFDDIPLSEEDEEMSFLEREDNRKPSFDFLGGGFSPSIDIEMEENIS